jgi:hypothetical protein
MAGSYVNCLPAKRPSGPMDFECPYKPYESLLSFKRLDEVRTHARPIAR